MHSPIEPLHGHELAVRAERIDSDSWIDQWSCAPPPVRQALGLELRRMGPLDMLRSQVPFSHFNMVLTLGCPAPVDAAAFDAIDGFYGSRRHWVLVNDESRPVDLASTLLARGYARAGVWDRVVLQGAPVDRWRRHAGGCETVGAANVDEWAGFIRGCYGMPAPVAEWLQALARRPCWIHALRREGGRPDGRVVMVRSLFHDTQGWAWLGIDAPVPGVMAPCFEDDQHLVATLLTEAAARGVRRFVSDIEAPEPSRSGEAYRRWGALGFEAVYRRNLFARGG